MINARELRIGNWILWGDKKYIVEGINKTSARIHENGQVAGFVSYKRVYPIELTSELLIKYGFKRWGDALQYEGYIDYWRLTFSDDGWIIYYAPYKGRTGQEIAVVKYIHQLQNLYYCLTGSELNIQL